MVRRGHGLPTDISETPSRLEPEIVESVRNFQSNFKTNCKLISDLPSCRSRRWSGGLHSSARDAIHRLLNELEGRVSKFMF